MSWGVKPDLMIGHSLGENTAACLAGVLTFEDALDLLILRGKLTQSAREGAMMSVNLSASRSSSRCSRASAISRS